MNEMDMRTTRNERTNTDFHRVALLDSAMKSKVPVIQNAVKNLVLYSLCTQILRFALDDKEV